MNTRGYRLVLKRSTGIGNRVPQRLRVVGMLEMIQESSQTFALGLETDERVRGILVKGKLSELKMLFGRRVLVLGTAVYRPSGRVLRIDAHRIEPGRTESSFWSRLPEQRRCTLNPREYRQPQSRTTGAAAIFGQWPGEETEAELLAALKDMG